MIAFGSLVHEPPLLDDAMGLQGNLQSDLRVIQVLNSCVTEPKAKGFCKEDDRLEIKRD